MDYILRILPNMFAGLGVSAQIFLITIVLSLPIGILLALVRISKVAVFRKLAEIYIYVMRGTPLMLQIMFIYYGLPLMLNVQISDFPAAILAFVANYAAYFAEIFRGGIQSIPKGQYEGAKVLGFTYRQTMWYIVIPQALKNTLPALANEFIVLLKETSVACYVAVNDLTRGGEIIRGATYQQLLPLLAVALIYLMMVMFFSWLVGKLERRLRNSDH